LSIRPDDARPDRAYDRETRVGRLDEMLDEADARRGP
jgi:hypothetical protein